MKQLGAALSCESLSDIVADQGEDVDDAACSMIIVPARHRQRGGNVLRVGNTAKSAAAPEWSGVYFAGVPRHFD